MSNDGTGKPEKSKNWNSRVQDHVKKHKGGIAAGGTSLAGVIIFLVTTFVQKDDADAKYVSHENMNGHQEVMQKKIDDIRKEMKQDIRDARDDIKRDLNSGLDRLERAIRRN